MIVKRIKNGGWKVTVEKGVAEILQEGGVAPKDIEAIIWRWEARAALSHQNILQLIFQ